MTKRLFRSVDEPIRKGLSFAERWRGSDEGLFLCWEVGRQKRITQPKLAEKAAKGELIPLGWKGGVREKLKVDIKLGTLNYLATWQGIKGENLDIDVEKDHLIVCTKTGQSVLFTSRVILEEE
jgi:hypothetical protein